MSDPYDGIAVADPYEGIGTVESKGGDSSSGGASFKIKYNGKTVTFNASKDASDEDIRKAANEALRKAGIKNPVTSGSYIKRQGDPDPAPPGKSLVDYGTMALRAVGEGLASIPDMLGVSPAGNAVISAQNAADFVKQNRSMSGDELLAASQDGRYQPSRGSVSAGGGVRLLSDMVGLAKPNTPGQRLASTVISGATSAAVPAVGAEALLARGVKAAAPFAAQKVAQIASGGLGSGSGELARQQGAGPLGQIAATVVGGVAPLTLSSIAKNAGSVLTTNFGSKNAPSVASLAIKDAALDPAKALSAIGSAPAPTAKTLPTLAEVAKDPGLAAFQRSRVTTPIAERQTQNAIARGEAADNVMGAGNPQAVQDMATRQLATGQSEVANRRAAIGPEVDRADSGAQTRDAFNANYDAARARTSAAYNVPALTEVQPIEIPKSVFDNVAAQAGRFYGDGGGIMPQPLQEIVSDMAGQGATSKTLINIDRRLADFAGEARMAGRAREAAFADELRTSLEQQTQSLMPPEYRDALAAAKAARFQQGQTFEQGPVARTMSEKAYAEPRVPDPQVPGAVIKPNAAGGSAADALVSSTGAANAEQTAREEMRRLVGAKELDTGEAVAALATRYGEALNRFPALKADMEALRDRAALLDAYRTSPLGSMTDASVEPAEAIAAMLTSKGGGRKLAALADQVRNQPEAMAGLRRSLGGFLTHSIKSGEVTAEGVAIPSALKAREAIDIVLQRGGMAKVLTAQQRIVLERIRQEFASVSYASKAGVAKAADGSIEALADMAGAASPKTGAVKSTIKTIWRAIGNGKEVDALLEKAILDPAFAAELLAKPTPDRLKNIRAVISASARGAAASSATQQNRQDDGSDPTSER